MYREELSKEAILRLLSQEQIMEHYLGIPIQYENAVCNPLREDTRPDCWFRKYDLLIIKDFARPEYSGDCFQVVKLKYSVNFYEALRIINRDFKLGLDDGHLLDYEPVVSPYVAPGIKPPERRKTVIYYEDRPFTQFDKVYWKLFGVDESLLKEYNVKRAQKVWIDGDLYYTYGFKNPCYVYDNRSQKIIYRPFSGLRKWRQCAGEYPDNIQGWRQLSANGKEVVITSSTKDIMTLRSIGIRNAVAMGSETPTVSDIITQELEARFDNIVVWYDNDNAGVMNSTKLTRTRGWQYINTPKDSPKDPSDYHRLVGRDCLISLIRSKGLCLM
jgi:hypothetical protein